MIPQGARLMLEAYRAGLRFRQDHPELPKQEALLAAANRAASQYTGELQPLQVAAFAAGILDCDDYAIEDYPMWAYDIVSGELNLAY